MRTAFSLVEMLVAVILISLLIGIAVFSFKHQLLTIGNLKKVGINKVIHYNQLRASIQSIQYYIVDHYDIVNQPMKKFHPYFNGTKDEVNYITSNPIFSKDIAVVKVECLDDRLVYYEEPLYKDIDYLKPTFKKDSKQSTIYNDLDVCEFEYIKNNNNMQDILDDIPSSIVLSLSSKNRSSDLHIDIKSDYNQSKGYIYDAVYPVN